MTDETVDPWLQSILSMEVREVVGGVPCLLPDLDPTHGGYTALREENKRQKPVTDEEVEEYLHHMLVPTCGNLFHGVKLKDDYPIPDFPKLPGGAVLDVGCNWGRWTVAGALAGHKMVGVDVHLRSLLVAQRLAEKLVPDNMPLFVLADARSLPFREGVFDGAASYSVIQHFSRSNAAIIAGEIGRVLKPGGKSAIQMPNKHGLKAMLVGAGRRGEGSEFDVRYYAVEELVAMFEAGIGPSGWGVDCFFGLNVQARDKRFVPASKRWIIDTADAFLRASKAIPPLRRVADSVWIYSAKDQRAA